MSNYKRVIERLLGLMNYHPESPADAIRVVIESGKLPKELCDKWVISVSERPVRLIQGRSGCDEWEYWARKFLTGDSTEALASQASSEATKLICDLREARKGVSSGTKYSEISLHLRLAYAAQRIADAIEMWHCGRVEYVFFNVQKAMSHVAVASLFAAGHSMSSFDSYFDAFFDLAGRENCVFFRAVLRGALEEDK